MSLGRISRQGVASALPQVRERADQLVLNHAGMIDNFLKLSHGGGTLLRSKIRLAAHIYRVKADACIQCRSPQLVGRRRSERLYRPVSITSPVSTTSPDSPASRAIRWAGVLGMKNS